MCPPSQPSQLILPSFRLCFYSFTHPHGLHWVICKSQFRVKFHSFNLATAFCLSVASGVSGNWGTGGSDRSELCLQIPSSSPPQDNKHLNSALDNCHKRRLSQSSYPFLFGRLFLRLLLRFSMPIMSCTHDSSGGRRRLAGTAATFAGSPNPKPPAELIVPVSVCGTFFLLEGTPEPAAEDEYAWPVENFRHIFSILPVIPWTAIYLYFYHYRNWQCTLMALHKCLWVIVTGGGGRRGGWVRMAQVIRRKFQWHNGALHY